MDPATIVALAALGLALFGNIAGSAYFIGRLSQTVADLKERVGTSDSCALALAAMTERLNALVQRMTSIEQAVVRTVRRGNSTGG